MPGRGSWRTQRPEEAIVEAERALALNPSFVSAYIPLWIANWTAGRTEKADEYADAALRLSPHDSLAFAFLSEKGIGLFTLSRYEEATEFFKRSIAVNPELCARLRQAGGLPRALRPRCGGKRTLRRYLALPLDIPKTIAQFKARQPYDTPNLRSYYDRLYEGLRKAGLPGRMSETRKIAAILVADVVGYSRLAGADEDRTLSRLRGLRSDLIDPAIDAHHGRVVKRTGDGILIEFRSVVDAVRCAIEVQNGLIERNAGLPPERRIEFRVGIHLGDVVEEADGDLMGDGVNIAARLEGIAKPGAICLSEDAYRQVKRRLDLKVSDLGPTQFKNIAEPIRVYSLEVGQPTGAMPMLAATAAVKRESATPAPRTSGWTSRWPALAAIAVLLLLVAAGGWFLSRPAASRSPHRPRIFPSLCCPSPISPAIRPRTISPTASPTTSPPNCRASAAAS